jgi:hypothetical protein
MDTQRGTIHCPAFNLPGIIATFTILRGRTPNSEQNQKPGWQFEPF